MSRTRSAGPARRSPTTRNTRGFTLATMAATLAIVALFVVLALLAARADAATRTLAETYQAGQARSLELEIPLGDVRIEGVERGDVRIRVEATCEGDGDCAEFVEGLHLESRKHGKALQVKLETEDSHRVFDLGSDRHDRGHQSFEITVTVEVPRSLALDLDLGAGEVSIKGLSQDVSVDVGAGEVNVRMPERAVKSVEVNLAVGETTIHQGGRTREYAQVLGGPVRWSEGEGDSEIEVNLGAGEVDVRLE